MKSALRRLLAQSTPPVPLTSGSHGMRGHSFDLGTGRQSLETYMRQYGFSGTLFSIVSLLAESAASPEWHLYKSQPVDGRRRYSTADTGSDQRIEVVQHAAVKLWHRPNDLNTGFEFREAAQQHEELTGETFWVLDNSSGFPVAMWVVRPDRMAAWINEDGSLVGWIYTGPNGELVPLKMGEVVQEKRPDPLDPYRGAGPVASILPNIQQQRYATEYQRNLFYNGAIPGGTLTVPNSLTDTEYDELVDRWRESHRGVARAGHVAVLENGATYTPGSTNKDLEYGQLRLANRDEMREAWRVHKSMLGTSDDVNRANAQTAEEVFINTQILTRLNRRRDTLNNKLLPLFGSTGVGVEFDYEDPSPVNAENAANELLQKSQAAQALIAAGLDPHAVLEAVGLPDMGVVGEMLSGPEPGASTQVPSNFAVFRPQGKNAASRVFEQVAKHFPPVATAWMHHASWTGPASVPLGHIDWVPSGMNVSKNDEKLVGKFADRIKAGKKIDPVILVKTPSSTKLQLVDGHHRYLAAAECDVPVRAYIGTVNADHGPWETMHDTEIGDNGPSNTATLSKAQVNYRDAAETGRRCGTCSMFREPNSCTLVKGLIRPDGVCDRWTPDTDSHTARLRKVLTNGHVPVEIRGIHA